MPRTRTIDSRVDAFKAHVRKGGYASDLKRYAARRQLKRLREAEVGAIAQLLSMMRTRTPTWCESLSADEHTLTDHAARPRADDGERPM